MSAPDNTAGKRANLPPVEHQFKPGNPGRPKGARNKLGEAFIQALHDDFNEHGIAAVEQVRIEKPDQYLKVIASLMPKEHVLSFDDQFSEMTDAELVDRVRQLTANLAPLLAAGADGGDEGASSAAGAELPSRLH